MRIAVIDNLPDGGARRVVWKQLRMLCPDHQVLYCTNEITSKFETPLPIQIEKLEFSPPRYKGWKRPLQELALIWYLYKWYSQHLETIQKWGVNRILVHPCRVSQAPLFLLLQKTIPTVYYLHEIFRTYYEPNLHPITLTGFKKMYEKFRLYMLSRIDYFSTRSASALITTSRYNRKQINKCYNKRTTLVPPGVDLQLFRPDARKSKQHFLFIGEKEDINGYDLLRKVENAHPEIPIRYVCFSGRELPYTEQELVTLYQHSYGVLCLSRREPFGLMALEGMACGIPIIAVEEAGYRDTVTTETGIFINRQPQQLFQAMQLLMKSEKIRAKLGDAGRQRVEELFSWDRHNTLLQKKLCSPRL